VFGANASTQSISGDTVINNNANITNLMAYALGENPYTIQALSLPEPILVLSNGTEYLAIQFQRNAEATDISYVVESSTSPAITGNWTPVSTFLNGGWSPAVNVIESGTPPQMNVEVSDTVPINSYPARFYHLKVIH